MTDFIASRFLRNDPVSKLEFLSGQVFEGVARKLRGAEVVVEGGVASDSTITEKCEIKMFNGDRQIKDGGETNYTGNNFTIELSGCEGGEKLEVVFTYYSINFTPENNNFSIGGNISFNVGGLNDDFLLAAGRYQFSVLDSNNNSLAESRFDLVGLLDKGRFTFGVLVK